MKSLRLLVIPRSLALLVLWIALWGELSVANVASGLVVVPLVSWLFAHGQPSRYSLRPWRSLVLLAFVAYSLVVSSMRVVLAVLRPDARRAATSVQRVQLQRGSVFVGSIVANAITLTPGTMTLELDRSTLRLDVHVLGEVDEAAFRDDVLKLERLVADAVREAAS